MEEYELLLKKYDGKLSFAGRKAFIAKAALNGLVENPARIASSRRFFERAGLLDALELVGEGAHAVPLHRAARGAFSQSKGRSDSCRAYFDLAQEHYCQGKKNSALFLYRRSMILAESVGEFEIAQDAAKEIRDSRADMYSALDSFLSTTSNNQREYPS